MTSGNWRTIRVVVEVKVPPNNRSTEKDLVYQVEHRLDRGDGVLPMPRSLHDDHYKSRPKVKGFTHVFRNEAKRPPERTVFERLMLQGIWLIVSILLPKSDRKQDQLQAWKAEARAITGSAND